MKGKANAQRSKDEAFTRGSSLSVERLALSVERSPLAKWMRLS
jgi:hypothetical protein